MANLFGFLSALRNQSKDDDVVVVGDDDDKDKRSRSRNGDRGGWTNNVRNISPISSISPKVNQPAEENDLEVEPASAYTFGLVKLASKDEGFILVTTDPNDESATVHVPHTVADPGVLRQEQPVAFKAKLDTDGQRQALAPLWRLAGKMIPGAKMHFGDFVGNVMKIEISGIGVVKCQAAEQKFSRPVLIDKSVMIECNIKFGDVIRFNAIKDSQGKPMAQAPVWKKCSIGSKEEGQGTIGVKPPEPKKTLLVQAPGDAKKPIVVTTGGKAPVIIPKAGSPIATAGYAAAAKPVVRPPAVVTPRATVRPKVQPAVRPMCHPAAPKAQLPAASGTASPSLQQEQEEAPQPGAAFGQPQVVPRRYPQAQPLQHGQEQNMEQDTELDLQQQTGQNVEQDSKPELQNQFEKMLVQGQQLLKETQPVIPQPDPQAHQLQHDQEQDIKLDMQQQMGQNVEQDSKPDLQEQMQKMLQQGQELLKETQQMLGVLPEAQPQIGLHTQPHMEQFMQPQMCPQTSSFPGADGAQFSSQPNMAAPQIPLQPQLAAPQMHPQPNQQEWRPNMWQPQMQQGIQPMQQQTQQQKQKILPAVRPVCHPAAPKAQQLQVTSGAVSSPMQQWPMQQQQQQTQQQMQPDMQQQLQHQLQQQQMQQQMQQNPTSQAAGEGNMDSAAANTGEVRELHIGRVKEIALEANYCVITCHSMNNQDVLCSGESVCLGKLLAADVVAFSVDVSPYQQPFASAPVWKMSGHGARSIPTFDILANNFINSYIGKIERVLPNGNGLISCQPCLAAYGRAPFASNPVMQACGLGLHDTVAFQVNVGVAGLPQIQTPCWRCVSQDRWLETAA